MLLLSSLINLSVFNIHSTYSITAIVTIKIFLRIFTNYATYNDYNNSAEDNSFQLCYHVYHKYGLYNDLPSTVVIYLYILI